MKIPTINPAHWRLSLLLELGPEDVHELACKSVGTLTAYRLVLGRCLLAMHESKGYKRHGCSSAIHYACAVLGMSGQAARECRRVAQRLQELPELTLAAELGTVEWSKLREIVRRAIPATEPYWLALAKKHSYKEIEELVRRTPEGSIPGEVDTEGTSYRSELRCAASPGLFAMIDTVRRRLSVEKEEAVTTSEVLELALASLMSGLPADAEALERARLSADKDLLAEEARRLPIVEEARELAATMGLLPGAEQDRHGLESALELRRCPARDISESTEVCLGSRHENAPTCEASAAVNQADSRWQNTRLRFNPSARHATKAQRTELLRRDGWCCRTPGCPNKVWLQLHHLHEYAQGGETTPDNLICLCSGCHRNVHQGSLKISEDEKGAVVYTNSEGARLDTQADLELANWLDRHLGWNGEELDSHQAKQWQGEWAVFVS